MKRIILAGIFLFIFSASMSLNAQWAGTYGGYGEESAHSIQQTSDGGYIVAGKTDSSGAGGDDIWILKLSLAGDIEWQYSYGGYADDVAHSILQTSDGGFIAAGHTKSFGAGRSDFWLLKLSLNGDIEWQRTYGGSGDDVAHSIQQTSDGGYIVAGKTTSSGAGGDDIWILKLSLAGDIEWQYTYGRIGDDVAHSIQQTSDGGYAVAGYTDFLGTGMSKFWVLKLSSAGDIEQQHIYGGFGDDEANSILQTSDGGYIVAGYTDSFGAGRSDFWLLKLSLNGNIEWEHTYGGNIDDYLNSILQTGDEGYIISGHSVSFGTRMSDFWVLKLSSAGDIEWQKTYGGDYYDYAYSIQQTSDEGYIVAGSTNSFGAGDSDFLVIKISSNGDIDPLCELTGSSNAAIQDTSATHSYINIIPQDTSFTPQDTNISPQETYAIENLLCEFRPLISGAVKDDGGVGIEGVTIAFSDEGGTATTDSEGNYSHTISYGWSGTATPSKSGYAFIPSSRSYTNVTSDQTDQDYTATVVYIISGSVKTDEGEGIGGVSIAFSNEGGAATTNSDGSYSHTVIEGWSGTAAASKTCYTFSPSNRSYTNVASDQTGQDYTGIKLTYTLSGTVSVASTPEEPLIGVVMDGLPGNPITNASGYYETTVDCGWSGAVTPAKERYVFSPPSRIYINVSSDQTGQDYTAYPGWIISGSVKTDEGEGIGGVSITFSNEGGAATTNSDGSYSHTVIEGWSGTATPSKQQYTFSPSSRDYVDVISDRPDQNYTGTPLPYTLIIKADTGGTTQPPPGNYNYYFGTQVAITAIPDSGYAFSHWTEDVPFGHENDNPLTITINSDKSVKAVFQKKGLCFIATAAYGTPSHPHVRILRDFRNKYLMPYKLGRYLVSSYYRHSPFVAELISKHRALKVAVQLGLIPLVAFSYAILHFGPMISGVTLVFIFVLPVLSILFYRRKMRRV